MTLRDYFCFLWYNFKKRRRFNKRRRRRLKNMKNARFNQGRFHRGSSVGGGGSGGFGGGGFSRDESSRRNSLIFKRRSVIYRNKHRKPTAIPAGGASSAAAGVTSSATDIGGIEAGLVTNTSRLQLAQPNRNSFSSNISATKRSVKFQQQAGVSNYSHSQALTPNNLSFSASGGGFFVGDELSTALYGASMSNQSVDLSTAEMARIKKNLSIYFENQIEDIV